MVPHAKQPRGRKNMACGPAGRSSRRPTLLPHLGRGKGTGGTTGTKQDQLVAESQRIPPMSRSNGHLCLPRLVTAHFRHFTLYNLEQEITVEFPKGVFCLAGANGLGKSTFLLAINYGI